MNAAACVVPTMVAVALKGVVEELRSLGMAAVFYQDFEMLTGDVQPRNECTPGINVYMGFTGGRGGLGFSFI